MFCRGCCFPRPELRPVSTSNLHQWYKVILASICVFENFPRLKVCTGTVSTNAKQVRPLTRPKTNASAPMIGLPANATVPMCHKPGRFPGRSHLNIYDPVRTTKVPSVLSCRSGNCPVHGQLRWKNGRRTQRSWQFGHWRSSLAPLSVRGVDPFPRTGPYLGLLLSLSDPIKHF